MEVVTLDACMENGKLDPTFKETLIVLLINTLDNSFELVNSEDGAKVIRNVKHLRKKPLEVDFDIPEPSLSCNEPNHHETVDVSTAETAPVVEIPPEHDPSASDVLTTRKGWVIRKPIRYRQF